MLPRTNSNPVDSVRTIRVTRGIFILRYVSSKGGLEAPLVSVETAGPGVELLSPSDAGAHLVAPGDGLVVHAAQDSFINFSLNSLKPNGSRDAELVLERISTTVRQAERTKTNGNVHRVAPESREIEILAHVARRGDVIVPAGKWICGPELPMVIEGLEIRWPGKPDGIDILSRATINARGHHTLPGKRTGAFQGTRGRAAPITTLILSLTGIRADEFSLACDALFLGQSVMSVSGASCALTGATGYEPLVGLRLSILPPETQHARPRSSVVTELPSADGLSALPPNHRTRHASSVRIFRNLALNAS